MTCKSSFWGEWAVDGSGDIPRLLRHAIHRCPDQSGLGFISANMPDTTRGTAIFADQFGWLTWGQCRHIFHIWSVWEVFGSRSERLVSDQGDRRVSGVKNHETPDSHCPIRILTQTLHVCHRCLHWALKPHGAFGLWALHGKGRARPLGDGSPDLLVSRIEE